MPSPTVRRFLPLVALAAAFALPATAQAVVLPTYPVTDPGPSTTAWYTDRYAPSGFANTGTLFGRDNVLAISLSAADSQTSRPAAYNTAFYNTQGRKVDAGITGPVSWIGSLYIPATWGTPSVSDSSGTRRSDMWGTVSPATGGNTCPASNCNLFPIIGFSNSVVPDADGAVGGTPRFRVFDGNVLGWTDLAHTMNYDAWADFCVTFTGTTIEYRIGDTLVYTMSDLTQGDTSFGPPAQIANVMVQAYNYGNAYDANWSRFAAGQATCSELRAQVAPVRIPPSVPVPLGPLAPLGAALAVALMAARRLVR
jgi:hypothetical protein